MKVKHVKHLFFLHLLLLVSCTPTSSPLRGNEKRLVGNWIHPSINGPLQGLYMEFHEDRTGVYGAVIKANDKIGIAPYMSFIMNDWRITNDTLYFQYKIQPGYTFYDSAGKEVKQNKKPSINRYIVGEMSDTFIILENIDHEFPGIKDRFKKSEKLELLTN